MRSVERNAVVLRHHFAFRSAEVTATVLFVSTRLVAATFGCVSVDGQTLITAERSEPSAVDTVSRRRSVWCAPVRWNSWRVADGMMAQWSGVADRARDGTRRMERSHSTVSFARFFGGRNWRHERARRRGEPRRDLTFVWTAEGCRRRADAEAGTCHQPMTSACERPVQLRQMLRWPRRSR